MDFEKTFDLIKKLQSKEKDLFKKLDEAAADSKPYETYIQQINDLTEYRLTLISDLSNNLQSVQERVGDGRTMLEGQMALTKVAEHEMNQVKLRLNDLEETKNNKLRMVEINNYFSQRYQAYSNVLKLVIYFCVPLVGLVLLKNYGLLTEEVYTFFTGVVLAVGIFVIARRSWDIFVRSDIHFEEYNWNLTPDPAVNHPTKWEYNKKHFLNIDTGIKKIINNLGIDCFGAACCAPGTYYDSRKYQCTTINEGFTRLPTIFEEQEQEDEQAGPGAAGAGPGPGAGAGAAGAAGAVGADKAVGAGPGAAGPGAAGPGAAGPTPFNSD
jgi:hypothetical protein